MPSPSSCSGGEKAVQKQAGAGDKQGVESVRLLRDAKHVRRTQNPATIKHRVSVPNLWIAEDLPSNNSGL